MDNQLETNIKNKLYIGQVIKNYKEELCTILDIPVKGGKAKTVQMNNIAQYCKLDQQGQKFIVVDIYDKPIPKIDNRAKNGGAHNIIEYADELEEILLHTLANNNGEIKYTQNQLLHSFGLCSEKYGKIQINIDKFAEEYEFTNADLFECLDYIYPLLRRRLINTLDNLVNYGKITYTKITVLYDKDNKECIEATEEQKAILSDLQQQTLKAMGLRNLGEVFIRHKTLFFYKKYYSLINKEIGYDRCWDVYNIKVTDINMLGMYYSDNEDLLLNTINEGIIENILCNAQRRHDKADNTDIYSITEPWKINKIEYERSPKYIENYQKFCNDFINNTDDVLDFGTEEAQETDQTEYIEQQFIDIGWED